MFDSEVAREELEDYREHGPANETQILLDAILERSVRGLTLIDIGGGVGAIQHELLKAGVEHGVGVDVSTAYLNAARSESERLGHAERMEYQHGDFVALAPQIEAADIVTLDRVICCYPDVQALVGLSSERAKRFYGVVFPRDNAAYRFVQHGMNLYFRLSRNPYRFFVHPTQIVDSILTAQGFRRAFRRTTWFWQVLVYERNPLS
jgi:2-polyprenyl-3-methyl-5-hydroxy-6-metoxy-1,4-benzoquinol methylase